MVILVLLILSVLLEVVGLVVAALSLRLVKDDAPLYRLSTLRLWMTPSKARTFFKGNGYWRLRLGGWMMGLGAFSYLITMLLK